MGDYEKMHAASLADAGRFWEKAAEEIDWYERWETALDQSRAPFTQWFKGATLNTCYNALDRHVDGGRGEQIALIYDSPVIDHWWQTETGWPIAATASALKPCL